MIQKERILEKLGITLNAMQERAYEAISKGRGDVVILSPTGSGKTLAYLLPLIEQLDASTDAVQALVVVPGRELALQSDTVLRRMGCGLRSQSCYGGRAAMDEHRVLRQVRPHVVFGTPGRLNDHLQKQNISPYGVRWLIIDEFDKCLEMGFQAEMEQLVKSLPGVQRRLLLSATNADEIPSFVRMQQTEYVDFSDTEQPAEERITMYAVHSPKKDKLDTLRQLLLSLGDGQSIVFLNYRDSVERVADYLRHEGFAVSAFHGGLEQKQREDALYKFANGSASVLVATDLASRGLDIPDIQNIVHYHLPKNEQEIVHRVGRTARWDKMGRTFFLVGPDESVPEFIVALNVECGALSENTSIFSPPSTFNLQRETPPQPRMATIYIGKGKKDKLSKGDIVGFLCKKGGLEPQEIGRIDVSERYTYAAVARERLQQVLRLTKGEKIKGIRTVVEPVK